MVALSGGFERREGLRAGARKMTTTPHGRRVGESARVTCSVRAARRGGTGRLALLHSSTNTQTHTGGGPQLVF
jgi:hypothetical protein